jgi:hypothetical protein
VSDEESAFDLEVPTTIRNWNFAKNSLVVAVLAVGTLWADVRSHWGLGWFGVSLLAIFGVSAVSFGVLWWRASLRIEFDAVRVGGPIVTRRVAWDGIERFSIMAPSERTPFLLAFWPWRDQAHVALRDGASHRVWALQPRHGFTALTYYRIRARTDADRTVDWLNRFARTRSNLGQPGEHTHTP